MSDVAAGDPSTDYVLGLLQDEALRPRLEEVIASHRADGSLDPISLGGDLRPLIEEMLDCTSAEDWQIAALCLIEKDDAAVIDGRFGADREPPRGRRAA